MHYVVALFPGEMKILIMKTGTDMKYNYLILALATAALCSCSGKLVETPVDDGEIITIRAYQEGATETRTTLIDGGTQVYWEPADEIKVFFNGSGGRFVAQNTENVTVATFTGTLPVVVGGNEGAGISTKTWGLYPYRADAQLDGDAMVTTLPDSQTGRAGSFAKNTNITLAQSDNYGLAFYNVCGGIRFSLTQEGVKEVVFQGQNDENIAGKVKLAFVDGVPAVQEVLDGQKSITLSAPYGTTFETGKWYYIVALPGTLSNGFKMTFNTDTQYATLKSSGSKTIKRGIFGSLADADEDLVYKDKEGGEPVTGNIVFADPAAKYACVAKFDTDGDGEVSYEEAEAATSFDGLFADWKGVASFDEIRYFKNVHSLDRVFYGCSKLVSITIPENINDLGTYAFYDCSSLVSIDIPSGVSAIGSYTFYNCSSLVSIAIPSNVTSVGQYAFYGCSSLTAVELPSGVTSIDNHTFQRCTSLVSIAIPSNVTSIGQYSLSYCSSLRSIDLPPQLKTIDEYAFYECSSLSQVVIPDGITSIPRYCFRNCVSLTSVAVPASVTSIGDYAFTGLKMWKLELPSTISSLGDFCFEGVVCVILPSASPIAIQPNTFNIVEGIFVPSAMIDLYRAMTNWARYSSKLHPIDDYREKNEFMLATSGAVDMGVSVEWAAFNLDATKPADYGGYYAWGETRTKKNYSVDSYAWYNGGYDKLTKYCPEDKTEYWFGSGSPDGKTVLDLSDDAAQTKLGDNWRIPTDEEWIELKSACLWESTTYDGVMGYMVYKIGGNNSIFIPAAGYKSGQHSATYLGSEGYYWSASLDVDRPAYVWHRHFTSSAFSRASGFPRYVGFSIRPVCD